MSLALDGSCLQLIFLPSVSFPFLLFFVRRLNHSFPPLSMPPQFLFWHCPEWLTDIDWTCPCVSLSVHPPPPPPLPIVFRWVMETRELTVVAGSFVGFQLLFSVASPPLSSAITPGYGRLPPTKLTEWNSRYVTGNAARQQAFSFHLSYLVFLQQRCAIVPLLVVMPAHFKRKGNRLCCITSRIGCNACGKKIMVDDHWWIFCSEDSNFIIWDCNFQWMWVNYLFIFFW